MYYDLIRNEFFETIELMKNFISDDGIIESIEEASKIISFSFKHGGKVLSCGNGGSHCNAMHFAEELTGRYRDTRKGYPALVISDPSYFSCVSNDFGYEYVFSRYLESIGTSNDVLLSISTSGRSINILNAIRSAHSMGMRVISLTGDVKRAVEDNDHTFDVDANEEVTDLEISIPHSKYADRIQEIHIKIIHILVLLIEREMSY